MGTFLTQDMHVQVDEVKISDYPGNSHICMPAYRQKVVCIDRCFCMSHTIAALLCTIRTPAWALAGERSV